MRYFWPVAAIAASAAIASSAAFAKPAKCFTTDDGHYACTFKLIDNDGSFEITAPGKLALRISITAPGTAAAFISSGERFTAMPGEYKRSKTDGACWENAEMESKICAW